MGLDRLWHYPIALGHVLDARIGSARVPTAPESRRVVCDFLAAGDQPFSGVVNSVKA